MTYATTAEGGGGGGGAGGGGTQPPGLRRMPRPGKLDQWQKTEDAQGITYYWNTKNPYFQQQQRNNSRNLSNGGSHSRGGTISSGYSPNGFPLSLSFGPPASSSNDINSPMQPVPRSASAANGYLNGNSTVYGNTATSGLLKSPGGVYSNPGMYSNMGFMANSPYNGHSVLGRKPSNERAALHRTGLNRNGNSKEMVNNNNNNTKVPDLEQKYVNGKDKTNGNANDSPKINGQHIWTTAVPERGPGFIFLDAKRNPRAVGGGGKPSTSRSKPRLPKFVAALCCCISAEPPSSKLGKQSQSRQKSVTAPQDLITQVQRPTSGLNKSQTVQPASGKENVSPPTPLVETPLVPLPIKGEKLLLPPLRSQDSHKKCLIIDLDETLVHSSFKPVKNPDFVIPVEIDNVIHQVYVLKRPFVDEFLAQIGDKFECVLFTASLAKYADPVADLLDKRGVFRSRLFREACVFHKGNYVKDLARLGRDLHKVIIVDNSPASYAFHPDNAIPVQTWFDDPSDTELLEIVPILERLSTVDSVYSMLRGPIDPRRSISPASVAIETRAS